MLFYSSIFTIRKGVNWPPVRNYDCVRSVFHAKCSPVWWGSAVVLQEKRNIAFMQELRCLFALMLGSTRRFVDPSAAVELLRDSFRTSEAQQVITHSHTPKCSIIIWCHSKCSSHLMYSMLFYSNIFYAVLLEYILCCSILVYSMLFYSSIFYAVLL